MKKLDKGLRLPKKNSVRNAITKSVAAVTLVSLSSVAMAQDKSLTKPNVLIDDVLVYNPAKTIPNQYIVVLKDEVVDAQARAMTQNQRISFKQAKASIVNDLSIDLATRAGGSVERTYSSALNGFVLKSSAKKAVSALTRDSRIAYVEADQMLSIGATQNNATWGLDRIDQENLPLNNTYNYDQDGSGVNAYVIDTGIRITHNQFGNRGRSGFTSINDGNGTNDCQGHGTHVAGTVGSTTYGVAKNATLYAVRVLGCNGSGSNSGVIAGVDWVAGNHVAPAVANMSLGGGVSGALDSAVNSAVAQGVTMVVAAGNDNSNACNFSPARASDAITVGSTTSTDARSSFSNYGTCLDIFAPGSSITSTWSTSNSATNTISGTSMAAPHVAGAVALYLDANPNATPAQIETALENAASVGKVGNPRTGSPNLLLNTNFGGGNPPPPPPPPGNNTLTNGVPVAGLSGAQGSQTFYTLEVPAGATGLSFQLSGGSGDADLYVRFGSAPTTSSYDCRPYLGGNNETCDIATAQAGTYHVMVRGYSAYSGASLVGSYTAGGGGGGGNFFENTTNVTIPGNTTGSVNSNINVTRSGASGTIRIRARIVHTWRGDLSVKIFAPNGASGTVHAQTNANDSGDNLNLDVNLNAGTIESNGTWRLEVTDSFAQDGGYLDEWSIEFQ
ncbi:S8 family serine peptidase [Marinicella sp. W31]|uniref:S8 family serine peptidase n=1 Tax=Marinicella sp. W31 TaxID=3023713 RepID=UPI003757FA07